MKKERNHSAYEKMTDEKFMKIALKLSQRGLGHTEPNPMVGAVVVKNGKILSAGYHQAFGLKHAETMALENVHIPGATLYLTLEPCCHFGKTPPCTELIIAKKISRVVMAMNDPNPLVNGRGNKQLKSYGIKTSSGLYANWAAHINRHYLKAINTRMPYVAIHAGVSLDGKLTDKNGHSQWITSVESRRIAHSLRGEFTAILAGHKTIMTDNPRLTLREPGWNDKTFYRVVLDSQNSLSPRLQVFQEQDRFPLIVFSSQNAANQIKKIPRHFFVGENSDGLILTDILSILFQLGIASVLVEGGGKTIDSFIKQQLFDEIILFVARQIVGGKTSIQLYESGSTSLAQALHLVGSERIELASGYILRGFPSCSPVWS
jgi:diaminohydroxyphosphoribosylaminopyrimidine deaminase/5-amino-6-(5-phosphoribosylamino)uracil reductase